MILAVVSIGIKQNFLSIRFLCCKKKSLHTPVPAEFVHLFSYDLIVSLMVPFILAGHGTRPCTDKGGTPVCLEESPNMQKNSILQTKWVNNPAGCACCLEWGMKYGWHLCVCVWGGGRTVKGISFIEFLFIILEGRIQVLRWSGN